MDVDSSHHAVPDPHTMVSLNMAVFGRQVRDGLPVLPGHYKPHNTWRELLEHREKAMARRYIEGREQWEVHTKTLPTLQYCDN